MEIKQIYEEYITEIRLPPYVIYITSILLGFFLVIIAPWQPDSNLETNLYNISLFFFFLPGLSILIGLWKPGIGKWVVIIGSILVIIISDQLLDIPGITTLMVLPPLIALVLHDQKRALIIGLIESLFLFAKLFFLISIQSNTDIIIALFLIWTTIAFTLYIYRSIFRFFEWTMRYFDYAKRHILESRDSRAELEQALKDLSNANNLLLHANDKAENLREVAEEARKTKALFVAKVSHEFRTPLNMIIGLVELMVEAPHIYKMKFPVELENDLKVVLRSSRHLSDLINDVLDLTRLESGQMILYKEWVNLIEIMEEAIQIVQPLIRKKNLDLKVSFPENLPLVYCDKTRIRQVILNLISNAARYTDSGGIHIEIEYQNNQVFVKVADTGPGIDPKVLERIFEPFLQGTSDPWKAKEGSGLGLSISKQFVELHGGQMWVKSELDSGSIFTFSLPVNLKMDFTPSPSRWINPGWVWREEQFKSTRVEYFEEKIKPCVIVQDSEGNLASVLEKIKTDIDFKPIKHWPNIVEAIDKYPTEAVLFISPTVADLIKLLDQAKKELKQVPLFGLTYSQTNPKLTNYRGMKYLIKPVTINQLTKTLDELNIPLSQILLVDDDPEIHHLFTKLLHLYNQNLSVTTALNGVEALGKLTDNKPDAIILDILMPEMDGWKFLEIIKQNPAYDNLPVIIISAQDPIEWPQTSSYLIATHADGLPLKKIIDWSLLLPIILEMPDSKQDQALPQTGHA